VDPLNGISVKNTCSNATVWSSRVQQRGGLGGHQERSPNIAVALLSGYLSPQPDGVLGRPSARTVDLEPFGSIWLISGMQSPCCGVATLSF
jgi:hypothetical protein